VAERAARVGRPLVCLLEPRRPGDGPHLLDGRGRGVGTIHRIDDGDGAVNIQDP